MSVNMSKCSWTLSRRAWRDELWLQNKSPRPTRRVTRYEQLGFSDMRIHVHIHSSLWGWSDNIITIERRCAWPLCKDNTHKSRSVSMLYTHLCTPSHTHMHVHIYVAHIHMYIHVCLYMCTRMDMYTCICMHTHARTCIFKHTYARVAFADAFAHTSTYANA